MFNCSSGQLHIAALVLRPSPCATQCLLSLWALTPLEKVSLLCVVVDWKFVHHVGLQYWLLLPLLYMAICAYKDSGMCLCGEC